MLPGVAIGRYCCAQSTELENYRPIVGDELVEEIEALDASLAGLRICHINSTRAGGGVAEMLGRYVPLLRAMGVSADWRLIFGEPAFFEVTKGFHNALQGSQFSLSDEARTIYLECNRRCAELLDDEFLVVHRLRPRPAPLPAVCHTPM